jgi:hypothetical protein
MARRHMKGEGRGGEGRGPEHGEAGARVLWAEERGVVVVARNVNDLRWG